MCDRALVFPLLRFHHVAHHVLWWSTMCSAMVAHHMQWWPTMCNGGPPCAVRFPNCHDFFPAHQYLTTPCAAWETLAVQHQLSPTNHHLLGSSLFTQFPPSCTLTSASSQAWKTRSSETHISQREFQDMFAQLLIILLERFDSTVMATIYNEWMLM